MTDESKAKDEDVLSALTQNMWDTGEGPVMKPPLPGMTKVAHPGEDDPALCGHCGRAIGPMPSFGDFARPGRFIHLDSSRSACYPQGR